MKVGWIASLVLIPGFLTAGAATIDGTWHIDGDVSGNPVNPTCVLAGKDGAITGTCSGVDGKLQAVKGTYTETSVKWSYESNYQGTPITLLYAATFDKDGKLAGTINVPEFSVDGSFTAKKD